MYFCDLRTSLLFSQAQRIDVSAAAAAVSKWVLVRVAAQRLVALRPRVHWQCVDVRPLIPDPEVAWLAVRMRGALRSPPFNDLDYLCGPSYPDAMGGALELCGEIARRACALQDPVDGGWSESVATYLDPPVPPSSGPPSMRSLTAWAVLALLTAGVRPRAPTVYRGVAWLVAHQTEAGAAGGRTWPEDQHTGMGFPRHTSIIFRLCESPSLSQKSCRPPCTCSRSLQCRSILFPCWHPHMTRMRSRSLG